MNRSCLFILLCLFINKFSYGQQSEAIHPLDLKYQSCLDSNSSTIGMLECISNARREWDKELNDNYKLLLSKLNKSQQSSLRESQKEWIIYRKKETKFYLDIYTREGTMWNVVMARRGLDIIRQRALELIEYYNTITEN
jgi:uncharacterized protein YecT (DUF1311 family)